MDEGESREKDDDAYCFEVLPIVIRTHFVMKLGG